MNPLVTDANADSKSEKIDAKRPLQSIFSRSGIWWYRLTTLHSWISDEAITLVLEKSNDTAWKFWC